ncbi:MAG: MFS transporter, partial [Deltaproteobacteria bacterium 21-66-5]
DPDYLKQERTELLRHPLNFDSIGLGLLVIVMSCWEIALSKGEQWNWFGDPFWRVQTLAVLFVAGLAWLIFRELRIANPVVNFRALAERNLAASCIIMFCAYGVLYGSSTSLPGLLQSLFAYDAYISGLVMSPSGVFSIMMMLVVGTLIAVSHCSLRR